ncbi:MAG: hypothetical protein LBJ17_02655 [Dysgonamonadaceae bacterium]|jgi:hypothetical protein|nr:hypothetical protein [Dysgonamonadaceae bacterium]
MEPDNKSVIRQFLPHITAVMLFILLSFGYFKPLLDGKVIQQHDLDQWRGMAQELAEYSKNNPNAQSAWTGSMFSGMPSYHILVPGAPTNYFGYVQVFLNLNNEGSAGPVFAGLLCAYIFFFLLTGNFLISLICAVGCAFASYNIVILQAGHVTKAWAIAFMPLVLSGFLLVFRKKYLTGGALLAFGLGVELCASHIQITYYLALFCLIIYLSYTVKTILKKEYAALSKSVLTVAVALILAIIPRFAGFYADWEMSHESLRGPSELSPKDSQSGQLSSGLEKDYAFTWSYGKGETLSLLIPNIQGGESGGKLGKDSNLYKAMKENGQKIGKEIQTYTYWGDKPFTSGPVYAGAVVCFLFVLGMFVIRSNGKWWLLGAAILFVFLSWGKHLSWFNDFLFYNLPMYNKFRTPEMSLVILALIMPIIAGWGLKYMISEDFDQKTIKKQLLYSLYITGGICFILWLMPNVFFNFESEYDKQFINQVPEWYYSALLADREALMKSDALRSLIFIILAAIAVYPIITRNRKYINASLIVIAVLTLSDLWSVDKRYLNDSFFVEKKQREQVFDLSQADKIILKDTTPSYRVLNISTNTFNDAATSYYHKSIGGYHAAKLRRYQELIDARLMPEIESITGRLRTAQSESDLDSLFINTPAINMLNGRYIIYHPDAAPLVNPDAFGNAWFVEKLQVADNADAELAALNVINPKTTAVADKRFEDLFSKNYPVKDDEATITLTEYRPERLTYHSSTASEQLAVFSEIYFADGWKAFIDGKPAPHFRADWTLRAMYIPAGEHEIIFLFEPDKFLLLAETGEWASALFLLLFAGILLYSFIKSKREN